MIIEDIKNFISSLKNKELHYWSGKEVDSFEYPNIYQLKKKFLNNNFTLNQEDTNLLLDLIPDNFSHIIHYEGNFFKVNFGADKSTVSVIDKSQFKNINPFDKPIFDLSRLSLGDFLAQTRAAYELLKGGIKKYENECIYNEKNYSIERIVEKEIDISKYDLNYSLTKEQTKKMYEWQKSHNKKYHKKGFGYQGASPVSNFEVRFGSCSLGSYADCVCTKCYNEWKEETDDKKKNKLAKFMQYELFNNM